MKLYDRIKLRYLFLIVINFIGLYFIFNLFNLIQLDVVSLNSKTTFKYVYQVNFDLFDNQRLPPVPTINGLNEDKYLVDSLMVKSTTGKTITKIKVNKTISRKNLLTSLIPHTKFIILQINPVNPIMVNQGLSSNSSYYILVASIIASIVEVVVFIIMFNFISKVNQLSRLYVLNPRFLHPYKSGIIILLCGFIILNYAYFSQQLDMNLYYNADELFLIDLFNNLSNGGKFSDWYLTQVPFFFPDYLLFALCYIITSNTYILFILYAMLQAFVIFSLTYWLLRQFLRSNFAFAYSAVIVWSWILCAIFISYFSSFLQSIYHFGSFINLLLLLTISLKIINSDCSKLYKSKWNYLLFITLLISTLSDEWIIIWYSAPFIIALLLTLKTQCYKQIKYLVMISNIIFASWLGSSSYHWVIAHDEIRPHANLLTFNWGETLKKCFFFIQFTVNNVMLVMVVAISCFLVWSFVHYNKLIRNNLPLKLLMYFYLILAPLIILTLLSFPALEFAPRYMLPIFFLTVIWSILAISEFSYLLPAIILISLLIFIFGVSRNELKNDYYPPEIACVDQLLTQYNMQSGVSQYWIARKFNYLTKTKANLVPINGITHQHYKFEDYDKHYRSAYDFAIIDSGQLELLYTLDESSIITKNSAPKIIKECGNYKVIIFKPGALKIL